MQQSQVVICFYNLIVTVNETVWNEPEKYISKKYLSLAILNNGVGFDAAFNECNVRTVTELQISCNPHLHCSIDPQDKLSSKFLPENEMN